VRNINFNFQYIYDKISFVHCTGHLILIGEFMEVTKMEGACSSDEGDKG
jgi:hypothetical protein